jgi:hypothetical protein
MTFIDKKMFNVFTKCDFVIYLKFQNHAPFFVHINAIIKVDNVVPFVAHVKGP